VVIGIKKIHCIHYEMCKECNKIKKFILVYICFQAIGVKRFILAKVSTANFIISSIAIINTAEDMLAFADKLVFIPSILIIFTLSSFQKCFVVTSYYVSLSTISYDS